MTVRKPARYEEIADYLRRLVASSPPEGRLPSDAELCARFSVSRMTARQAVQLLVGDGLVVRRRGAGTFVRSEPVLRDLGSPLSFTESMRRRGMTASSRILKWGKVQPNEDEMMSLRLAPGEPVQVLERLRLADGTPMAIERVVMPVELADAIDGDFETGSLHAAFERAGRHPTEAVAEVTARHPTKRQRELLELSPNGILLSEQRTILDQDGNSLERTVTHYASSRYSFRALLVNDQAESG